MTKQRINVTAAKERELFADGPVIIFRWRNEPGWPVNYVSPNVEQLFGYSPAELCNANPPYAELVHDDDLDQVGREVKTNSDETTERFHHKPYRMVTRDGNVRWVLDYTRIIRTGGEITEYMGYVVDITEYKEQLEYVTSLNVTIRSLQEALIGANSRERIHEDVCRLLFDLECFDGVWIGTIDAAKNEVVPTAHARVSKAHFDELPLTLDGDSPVPAVRIATARATAGEHQTVSPDTGTGRERANIPDGSDSVFAAPISHRGMLHGVLTVYGAGSDTFDGRVREMLLELGTVVGYTITAVERRNTLYSDGTRNLVLDVSVDDDDPLRLLAEGLSAPVEVRSVSRRKRNSPLLYCLIPDTEPEEVMNAGEAVPGIKSVKSLPGGGASIYELVSTEQCAASKMTALGASLRVMCVTERDCELTLSVCRHRDQRRFIEQVRELFGDAELKAERGADPSETMPWPTLLADALTEQQQNVLKTAYHSGYFDENRKQTGAEIAERLGIAQPTFSNHMRAAQRNLFSAIWGETGDETLLE